MKTIVALLIALLFSSNVMALSSTRPAESFELSENYGKSYGVGTSLVSRIDNLEKTGDILLVDLYAIAEGGK